MKRKIRRISTGEMRNGDENMTRNVNIGLAFKSKNSTYEENYVSLINRAGASITPFYADAPLTGALAGLENIDGLVIPGGADVSLETYYRGSDYAEMDRLNERPVYPELDRLEWLLIEKCLERSIPMFGICRGFQLINLFMGGTLFHDLPTQFGSKVVHRHHEFENASIPRRKPLFHDIDIAAGSSLGALLKSERVSINTFHHQGVRDLAEGLRPLAWSADGLTEAFENAGGSYIFAVQFHPEKHCPYGELLMGRFVSDIG